MSQGSLFDASVYIMRAYDQLVLAYSETELEQLRTLKAATLSCWHSVQELALGAPPASPSELDRDGPTMPF
jgi:hypothetical protein